MYSQQSALAQYRKIDHESVVQGANPHQLIQMLMQGALDRLNQARAAFAADNIEQKGILIGKAISIIAGLQASLDPAQSEDIAGNLDNLYDYMQRRLLVANLENDMAKVTEVAELLQTVKGSWDAIAPDS